MKNKIKQPIFDQAVSSLIDSLSTPDQQSTGNDEPREICDWAEENFYVSTSCINNKWQSWRKPIILSPYQKEAFRIIMPKVLSGEVTLVVWSEPKKSGKCLWEGERVTLADGSCVEAKELIDREFKVLAFDLTTLSFHIADAKAADNGIKHCIRLRTKMGREITATENHRLLTFGGWRRLDELKVGDKVAIPTKTPELGIDTLLDEEIEFLAMMIGDGAMAGNFTFCQNPGKPLVKRMVEICNLFGVRVKYKGNSIWGLTTGRGPAVNPLRNLARKHGILGKISHEKFVPLSIHRASNRQIALFLNRLWACDGSITKENGRPTYGTTSKTLAEDILQLLQRLSIFGTLRTRNCPKCRLGVSYEITIGAMEDVQQFVETVGIYGRENDIDQFCWPAIASKKQKRFPQQHVFAKELFQYIRNEATKKGMSFWEACRKPTRESAPTRKFVAAAARRLGDARLANWTTAPIGWDSIKEIKPIGKLKTVGIEVPKYQTYVSRFIEHNSTIQALVGQWWAEQMEPYNEIIFVANDREQAEARGFAMMIQSIELNPESHYTIRRRMGNMLHDERKTIIKAIPCDFKGEAGANQGLSLYDELWGYTSENSQRLWDELTPPPTRAVAIRWVVTYAGFKGESTLLWDIYERVVGSPRPKTENRVPGTDLPIYQDGSTIVFWSHQPRQPWQTQQYYAQQRAELRPSAFTRLHENQWVQKETAFVPLDDWDACKSPYARRWEPGMAEPLIIAIDASQSRDCTALVATYADQELGKTRLLEHRIWLPEPSDLIKGHMLVDLTNTVERRIYDLAEAGAVIPLIVYDPYQMSTVALNLAKAGFHVQPFSQGDLRIKADTELQDLIVSKNLEIYENTEDLRYHIENSVKREGEKGFRISKKLATKPCDGAVALS
ncbi:hypothetical protein KKH23_06250, partial [Patescibacteria group bacterium]|nr:hypothetical protein [Patescibacteria group bacterium]